MSRQPNILDAFVLDVEIIPAKDPEGDTKHYVRVTGVIVTDQGDHESKSFVMSEITGKPRAFNSDQEARKAAKEEIETARLKRNQKVNQNIKLTNIELT